ncbi:cytochrome C oxidase subunit I [Burkholderia glumae]|uniref:SCO family protein n=1 Tax=Burkholderia glumae TaxID=337 RepID=UPI000F5FBAB0|nr:cytochrome C oxidase subunit I [Burkholderia glumae]MCM2549034.1 cytochrome C oxidase subunit I [Burkholderia glumae]MCQ0033279.1 cytochrome C oxidase subunit I [Burkholderia glumae]MCQ0039440.1 cytochrome C oxidase subunit I [Burkholderia glumae]QGA36560.1 cytochrome C oxidase subunit I [Burkholderia glumae]RQZ73259.1 cytochrome C oxidase subunit I [Burkholderia glumae]
MKRNFVSTQPSRPTPARPSPDHSPDRPSGQGETGRDPHSERDTSSQRGSWRRGRWVVLALCLICAAPLIASYFTYYVIKPRGASTNYGTLIEPQRPIPATLTATDENGRTVALASLRGVWLLMMENGSLCDDACARKLYFMRQVRATQGGERQRITMVWLRRDAAAIDARLLAAYPDTRRLVADPAALDAWLPAEAGTQATDHIYLVDPNGNLMMRFPKDPDPSRIKHDVTKLLKWSSIG